MEKEAKVPKVIIWLLAECHPVLGLGDQRFKEEIWPVEEPLSEESEGLALFPAQSLGRTLLAIFLTVSVAF